MPATDEMADAEQIVQRINARHRAINKLVDVAEQICSKMERPTASVTILDQEALRAAINAVRSS